MYIVVAGVVTSFTVQLEHHEIRYVMSTTQCQIITCQEKCPGNLRGGGGGGGPSQWKAATRDGFHFVKREGENVHTCPF